ncbi:hypothetical protein G9A89_020621 [Geosiphon pyriformis]|nr:hypothetical protein G9A89_020621 [Geosiphon pyriformis]
MPAHLLDIKQELLQEVQVFIEHVNIDKLLAIDFINIDKFEPLFTYVSENEIVDFINNKYSGNSNANKDLESENEDKPLPLLSTHQSKIALENTLHYCEEQYKTETGNKGKQKAKQHSKTTSNTPILPKTTAKHLQTSEQETSIKLPFSITLFPISLVQPQTPSSLLNRFSKPEDFQSPRNPIQQQEPISTSANIIDYLQENESNHSKSLESEKTESEPEEITENKEEMTTAYIAKIPEFTDEDNDTKTNNYYSDAQILDQFIAGLKDKLIKKVCPHAPADLTTAIRHVKSYEMAMEEANHTKFVNLAIGETSSAAEEKIDQLTKKQQYQQPLPIQPYQTPPTQQYQVPAKKLVQHNQFTPQNQLQSNNNRINPNNQLVPRNSGQQRPNHYHTQLSYLIIPEKSDFQQTALSEGEVAAPKSNPFNHTIPPAQIAQNANLSNIFPFEFEANESPFLLSNAAINEQKAITAMYTEATVKGKPIHLILDSGSAGNRPAQTVIVTADGMKKTPVGEIDNFLFTIDGIIIPVKVLVMDAPQYQALVGNDWLLKANAYLNWETQELKISYQEQYTIVPATCSTFNKQSEKAPVFEFKEEKEMPLTETYMALRSPSNWAEKTEQEIFEELRG